VQELSEQTGAHIRVPAHSVLKDEIVVSGEKEGVMEAKLAILKIYEEKVKLLSALHKMNETLCYLYSSKIFGLRYELMMNIRVIDA